MATSSTSARCSCRFMGGSFAGHYSKDTRTARRYMRREARPRPSGCCPESTMPRVAHPCGFCTSAPSRSSCGMNGGVFLLPFSNFYFLFSKSGGGAELACRETFQGAEACVEFRGRQAPQAVERPQKIRRCSVALARVAFETAGNQVAVGIAPEAHAGHDVVEAVHVSGSAAKTVKAGAALAIVNGFAERPGFQEIRGFERRGRRLTRGPRGSGRAIFAQPDRADLLGQAHLCEMAGLAAFEH